MLIKNLTKSFRSVYNKSTRLSYKLYKPIYAAHTRVTHYSFSDVHNKFKK